MGFKVFCCGWSEMLEKRAVGLGDLSVSTETFARHLKIHLFRAFFSDQARTFELVLHFVGCVTMSG